MVDYLKEYAATLYTDEDVIKAKEKYAFATPLLKNLLYRDIFESFYPGQAKWVKDFWMPNKDWENCNVDDPSARVLKTMVTAVNKNTSSFTNWYFLYHNQ